MDANDVALARASLAATADVGRRGGGNKGLASVEAIDVLLADHKALVAEVERLRVQVAHLSEDVIAYGEHGSKCDYAVNAGGHGSKCDCGFHEALGNAESICWQTAPAEVI